MFKHYLVVAFRNLSRQKSFTAINVIGLALGMTCCLFIYLWIADEKNIDNIHSNGDKLYTVYETVNSNNVITGSYATTIRYTDGRMDIPITDIKHAAPEVEGIAFYATGYELPWGYPETFQVGDKLHKFSGSRASEDFFKMFSYEVIAGDRTSALKDLSSIAISRNMAETFFNTAENAIGKSIRYENKIDFVVTAVFQNVSHLSSMRFEFLINWESQVTRLAWASNLARTTLQIKEGTDLSMLETKINRFMQARLDQSDPRKVTLGLQPFRDQHLKGDFVNGKPSGGRIKYVKIFSGVGVFILIIACINFMNLATARSLKRAREIGVRKVVGSTRGSLICQFFGESMVISFLALLVSLALLHLLLPAFNSFTAKQISSPVAQPIWWIVMLCLMIFTGLVAGSYPALFLSSLKPIKILNNTLRTSGGSVWIRKGLAGFQFVISIILLIVTIVISQQTSFVQKANLGYDRENLLYMQVEGELMDPKNEAKNYRNYSEFKNRALAMPGIAMVDRSSEAPHAMSFVVDMNDGLMESDGQDAIQWEGKEKGVAVGFKPMSAGFDFLDIMNLKVVEGRGFSREFPTDSADAFMVNETAVKQMGMKDPLGKWISAWNKKGHIIGVLKDYHTHSLHEPIKPLILDVKEYEYFGVMIIRTEAGKTQEALASLEKLYKETNPNYPFGYQFVDQEYDKLYRNEQVISKLSNASAVVAIMISCLGLLGLVIFTAEQRTKEFGIRKVLGATVTNIVSLLSQDFIKLVVISFCIAAPIGGYFMHQWLESFAYKIELSWWIFALAGGIALFIAFLTVCAQAFQTAVANPVKSLRSE